MQLSGTSSAGTLESSDAMVTIRPGTGLDLVVNSIVEKQFGKQIRAVAMETLQRFGITDALVEIQDKGALECVLRARLETALLRALGDREVDWERVGICMATD